jgi:hypothetical protein
MAPVRRRRRGRLVGGRVTEGRLESGRAARNAVEVCTRGWHVVCRKTRGEPKTTFSRYRSGGFREGKVFGHRSRQQCNSAHKRRLASSGVVFRVTARVRLAVTAKRILSTHLEAVEVSDNLCGTSAASPPAPRSAITNEVFLLRRFFRCFPYDVYFERLWRTSAPPPPGSASEPDGRNRPDQSLGWNRSSYSAERGDPGSCRQDRLRGWCWRVPHPARRSHHRRPWPVAHSWAHR